MNDYFDIDLYYGALKVSVGSSFFRVVPRPRFSAYGVKGAFIKATEDRQEEHLKLFVQPGTAGFGVDAPDHYGTLTYVDDEGVRHEERVPTCTGDYARFYDGVYATIVDGAPKVVTDEQTIELMGILAEGITSWVPAPTSVLTGPRREGCALTERQARVVWRRDFPTCSCGQREGLQHLGLSRG